MQEESKKNQASIAEEYFLGMDDFVHAEKHLSEVAGKTENDELEHDCKSARDELRLIRQRILDAIGVYR